MDWFHFSLLILKVSWVAEFPQTEKKVFNSIQTTLEGTRRETRTKAAQSES